MIYDGLAVIERYRGLYKGLDVLIDWLAGNDPANLSVGRNEICGDKVFANVMQATTHTVEDGRFEVHHRYMDLQIDLEGRESFRTATGDLVLDTPFDEKNDGVLGMPEDGADVLEGNLDAGHFVIFAVNEPHMPTCVFDGDGERAVKKICFKILADKFW